MTRVSASIALSGSVYEAETWWYDTARWTAWVDQLSRVIDVSDDWPEEGSAVVWESNPAGRGTVHERVISYEPRSGQESDVEDDTITGRQTVAFRATDDGVEVHLGLDYRLKKRSPVSALVDLLFIRRLMSASLARTLAQFGSMRDARR